MTRALPILASALALAASALASSIPPLPSSVGGFSEEFEDASLPGWSLATYPGPFPRAHGYSTPANEFSMSANPGHLRYVLQAMTHHDGFLNGMSTDTKLHSSYTHDAGLELRRPIAAKDWTLETKVSFHMPYTNGRALHLRVYFGDGGPGTIFADFWRARDVGTGNNNLHVGFYEKAGDSLTTVSRLAPEATRNLGGVSDSTHFFRLARVGDVLTASLSDDGATWTPALSVDAGPGLDARSQTVVLAGLSWFIPAGSFADWDYVRVTPATDALAVGTPRLPGAGPG